MRALPCTGSWDAVGYQMPEPLAPAQSCQAVANVPRAAARRWYLRATPLWWRPHEV